LYFDPQLNEQTNLLLPPSSADCAAVSFLSGELLVDSL